MSVHRTFLHETAEKRKSDTLSQQQVELSFGSQILDLVPKADSVTKLASWCTYCEAAGKRQDALFSLRIAADDRQEVVGGADKYAPVCRQHYISLSSLRHKQH